MVKIASGALWEDALKAGFSFGIAAPDTTPYNFFSHIDLTIDGPDGARQTFTCDAQALGRAPRYPMKDPTVTLTELARMADLGHKACFAQITAKLDGTTTAAPLSK